MTNFALTAARVDLLAERVRADLARETGSCVQCTRPRDAIDPTVLTALMKTCRVLRAADNALHSIVMRLDEASTRDAAREILDDYLAKSHEVLNVLWGASLRSPQGTHRDLAAEIATWQVVVHGLRAERVRLGRDRPRVSASVEPSVNRFLEIEGTYRAAERRHGHLVQRFLDGGVSPEQVQSGIHRAIAVERQALDEAARVAVRVDPREVAIRTITIGLLAERL